MLLFIILLIITIVWCVFAYLGDSYKMWCISRVTCFVLLVVCFISSCIYTSQLELSEVTIIDTQEITTLKDNNESSGHAFIGTGSVNTNTYYYYYAKSDDGVKMQKLNADKCTIIESSTETPHIDTVIMDVSKETKDTLAYKLLSNPIISLKSVISKSYKIYVPEGSLTEDFIIEME